MTFHEALKFLTDCPNFNLKGLDTQILEGGKVNLTIALDGKSQCWYTAWIKSIIIPHYIKKINFFANEFCQSFQSKYFPEHLTVASSEPSTVRYYRK